MWNPLILQPHHKKNCMCTLLTLKTHPWAAAHCKASAERCHSPGMDQNQTLLPTQPCMQGARVEACSTEIQTQFTSFLRCLVTEGTWSATLGSQDSPVFQWGQHGGLEKDKDLFDSLLNPQQLSNGWLNNCGVLLGIVSNHMLLTSKKFKSVICRVEQKWDHEFGSELAEQKPLSGSLSCN